MATVTELRALLPAEAAPRMNVLETRLDEYWEAFEPLFTWTLYEKVMRSGRFLRQEVLPRREAVLEITRDVEQLNNANLLTQRAEVARRLGSFREDLHRRLFRALALGFVVALVAVLRLRALERRSEEQRIHANHAEQQMRLLSQQLVAAQEAERKNLTRELHDHVGQMLTALRMEIGRADRARGQSETQLAQALGEARRLLDTTLRSVRDLVMGLRPSMLDDFGLRPALEWHVRDFRRRFNIPVDLTLDGDLDSLPDPYRTAVYRIVQEALTNCARHSHATRVAVSVCRRDGNIELRVADDGTGIDPGRARGMGLLGIEERARELRGAFHVASRAPQGTEIVVTLPVTTPVEEVPLARAAG
jgi:signal transduction histidine kinase